MTAPLIPADVDLRDFQYMPLDVVRLRDSALIATRSSDAVVAAILLWCAAWHQVPASSLPDDDVQLARLAGYGRGVNDFQAIRDGAVHSLVRCDDGRFYHPVVAEKAAEAWNSKLTEAWRRACDAVRKSNKERGERGVELLPTPARPRLLIRRNSNGIPVWMYEDSAGLPRPPLRKSRLKGTEGKGTEGKGVRKSGVASQPLPGLPPGGSDYGPRDANRNGLISQAKAVLAFLNERADKRFPESENNVGVIVARMREGFTPAQIRQVVAMKVRKWKRDDEMREYLRPDTLFNRKKFSNYVGELVEVVDDRPPDIAGDLPGQQPEAAP